MRISDWSSDVCSSDLWAALLRAMRSKNWKLARACASPALRRLCLISMMTIDRPETAAEFFARRSKGRAVGDLDRILDKVPDRPPEPDRKSTRLNYSH